MSFIDKYRKYKEKYISLKSYIKQDGGRKDRPSPSESATKFKVGTKKKGGDGNMWIVVMNKNKVKRWAKLKKGVKKVKKHVKKEKVSKIDRVDEDEISESVEVEETLVSYPGTIYMNLGDHIIQSCVSIPYYAYFIMEHSDSEFYPKVKNFAKIISKIAHKAIPHPWSNGKVMDIIHPSRYPYVRKVSKGYDGKVFKDKYLAYNKERRDGYFITLGDIKMEESNLRWLPTVYRVKKMKAKKFTEKYSVVQKSYINDLFDLDRGVEEEIAKMFAYAIQLFTKLSDKLDTKIKLFDRDLQVIVKVAYYELKPGETHEGVWHVEGMPDEHIIMSSICYFEDDFKNATLEFRRDRSEEEQENLLYIPEQNAQIIGGYTEAHQHLGYLKTEMGTMYAWANACQHRLMEIKNDSKKVKRRAFLAFFLVDPDVKIVSTQDIPPQNRVMSDSKAKNYMVNLMKERKSVKVKLNKGLEQEISYCEH